MSDAQTCRKGHDLTDPNVGRIHSNGVRTVTRCMICQRAARQKRYDADPRVRELKAAANRRYKAKLKESSVAQ